MINNDVSVLGIGPGLSAPLFNIGLIMTGITAVPFYVSLGRILQQENSRGLSRKTIKLSIVGCLSLSLIGCFPLINLLMSVIHVILAIIFFVSALLSLMFFSRMMLREESFSNIHAYLGYIIGGIVTIYLITRLSIIEWIVFFALGVWIVDISIYTLYKRQSFE